MSDCSTMPPSSLYPYVSKRQYVDSTRVEGASPTLRHCLWQSFSASGHDHAAESKTLSV